MPPQKWRKNEFFEANLHVLVQSFCLRSPHKLRRPISTKIWGRGAYLTPQWRPLFMSIYPSIYLFFFSSFHFSFPLSFPLFFFLSSFSLSFFFFWRPFSDQGWAGPPKHPRVCPATDRVFVQFPHPHVLICKEYKKGQWTTSASSPFFFQKKLRFLYH